MTEVGIDRVGELAIICDMVSCGLVAASTAACVWAAAWAFVRTRRP